MIPARIASTTSSGTSVIPWADAACALWVERTQARQTDASYRCLTTLASARSQLGDQQLAVTLAESAVQLGPLREMGHRLLIEAEGAAVIEVLHSGPSSGASTYSQTNSVCVPRPRRWPSSSA